MPTNQPPQAERKPGITWGASGFWTDEAKSDPPDPDKLTPDDPTDDEEEDESVVPPAEAVDLPCG